MGDAPTVGPHEELLERARKEEGAQRWRAQEAREYITYCKALLGTPDERPNSDIEIRSAEVTIEDAEHRASLLSDLVTALTSVQADDQKRREEATRYGLPENCSLATLLRHIYGNRDAVYGVKDAHIKMLEDRLASVQAEAWTCMECGITFAAACVDDGNDPDGMPRRQCPVCYVADQRDSFQADLAEADRKIAAAIAMADSENPTVQALAEENERLQARLEMALKGGAQALRDLRERLEAERDSARRMRIAWERTARRLGNEKLAVMQDEAAATSREKALREAAQAVYDDLQRFPYEESGYDPEDFATLTANEEALGAALATTPVAPPRHPGVSEAIALHDAMQTAAPPSSSREDAPTCQRLRVRLPSSTDDDVVPCGAPAAHEVFGTDGEWKPWCTACVNSEGVSPDRVRPLSREDDTR